MPTNWCWWFNGELCTNMTVCVCVIKGEEHQVIFFCDTALKLRWTAIFCTDCNTTACNFFSTPKRWIIPRFSSRHVPWTTGVCWNWCLFCIKSTIPEYEASMPVVGQYFCGLALFCDSHACFFDPMCCQVVKDRNAASPFVDGSRLVGPLPPPSHQWNLMRRVCRARVQ